MRIACQIRCVTAYQNVQDALARAGFDCVHFISETSLMRALRHEAFDLLLLDANTEAREGHGIFSWLHCLSGNSTPVVLLSSACNSARIAQALEAGADDFINGVFEPRELVARVNAVLRRYRKTDTRRRIEAQGFTLDLDASTVLDRDTAIELTAREFKMAWLFFSSPGTYLSREAICAAVWGIDSDIATRTIEQHVYKLRRKLILSNDRGVRIRTAYTKGYRLELCNDPTPCVTQGDGGQQADVNRMGDDAMPANNAETGTAPGRFGALRFRLSVSAIPREVPVAAAVRSAAILRFPA